MGESGSKKLCRKLLFLFLLIFAVEAVQTAKHLSYSDHNKETYGPDTTNFESLKQKHDRAYSVCKFKRKYVCDIEM